MVGERTSLKPGLSALIAEQKHPVLKAGKRQPKHGTDGRVNDMANFCYFMATYVFLGLGIGEQNAVLCCAAGLFAIAREIQAKRGE